MTKFRLFLVGLLLTGASTLQAQGETTASEVDDSPPAAELAVVKSVSNDGGATWHDAQIAPGLSVEIGDSLLYLIQVANTGDFALSNVALTDTLLDTSGCEFPETLQPGDIAECTVGPLTAADGQTVNTVLATAQYNGVTLTATDSAYAFAGDIAVLHIEKMAGLGGVWFAADSAPGVIVPESSELRFRIAVSNDGTETFTDIALTDSMVSLEGCDIPAELPPGLSFECVVGPIELDDTDAHVNTATVTAVANGTTYTASDEAHFRASDDDDSPIIIIEGPVTGIDGNIIIIFDIEIQIDPDDPILTVIRIGDIIRIEGNSGDNNIVIAIIVIVIDVDIYVGDFPDQVYRDEGECGNPPPPWAPAHGWRRKCQVTYAVPGALPPGLRDKKKNK